MSSTTDYISAYTSKREIDASKAGLLIIDMQYATGSRSGALARQLKQQGSSVGDYRFNRTENLVVPNSRKLIDLFHDLKRPVIYVTIGAANADALDAPFHMKELFVKLSNYVGSREHEIIDELKPSASDFVIRKTTIGAFASTGIDSLLKSLACEQVYLAGVSTNMCVETTAREAADRGYCVTLVEDACGTTHEDLHHATLKNFKRLFGSVKSTEQCTAELS